MRSDLEARKSIKTNKKFLVQLSDEQKEAKEKILDSKLAVITGKAGTSKSFLAAQIALDLKMSGCVDKIFLARPQVSTEDIGYIPGNVEEKMRPWASPILENMEGMLNDGKKIVDKMLKEGDIELLPIQHTRGRTVTNSILIVDEAQSATKMQTYLFATRLGKGSLMIFTGDLNQIDLKQPSRTGFSALIDVVEQLPDAVHVELKQNYRDPIVKDFMEAYEKHMYNTKPE